MIDLPPPGFWETQRGVWALVAIAVAIGLGFGVLCYVIASRPIQQEITIHIIYDHKEIK